MKVMRASCYAPKGACEGDSGIGRYFYTWESLSPVMDSPLMSKERWTVLVKNNGSWHDLYCFTTSLSAATHSYIESPDTLSIFFSSL